MFSYNHHQMYNPYNMSQPSQKWKPDVEITPNCPRCDSPNTKFCYYNNYSLTQPRYFCKGCRRYWTKGGSLRNVPVGGGCRNKQRSKSCRIVSSSMQPRRSTSEPLIWPDQALNDMVGGNSQDSTVDDDASTSTIDLAMLYNKFLNQSPVSEPEPVPASSDQNNNNIELGEFSYLLDSGGFGQLAIPTTVGTTDVFWTSSESFFPSMQWPAAPEQQGPGLGEDLMGQCQDFVHGDWCGSLDVHSNFGAFSM